MAGSVVGSELFNFFHTSVASLISVSGVLLSTECELVTYTLSVTSGDIGLDKGYEVNFEIESSLAFGVVSGRYEVSSAGVETLKLNEKVINAGYLRSSKISSVLLDIDKEVDTGEVLARMLQSACGAALGLHEMAIFLTKR